MESKRRLLAVGVAAVLVVVTTLPAHGAQKERVYPLGDSDPGAAVGATPPGLMTVDTQASTTDGAGSLVPLAAFSADLAPRYVAAADRPGAAAGNLALQFDGMDDNLFSPAFDPRHFGGSFATLGQAWVKPTAVATGSDQFIFRIGRENGSVKISGDGHWVLKTTDDPPEQSEAISDFLAMPNEWAHVAVVRGGNVSTLYVNGIPAARDTGFWGTPGPEVALGANVLGVDSFFNGVIDSFAITGFAVGGLNIGVDLDYFPDRGITFSGVAGDIDQDGTGGDPDDYQIWSQNVGFDNGLGLGAPGTLVLGDANQSGVIDLHDFLIINQAALAPPPPGAGAGGGTPEPTSLVLLALAAAMVSLCGSRRRWLRVARSGALLVAVAGVLGSAGQVATADVVVSDDFLYDGPTKLLNIGGGFNGYQFYRGGQNGPAGNWTGVWGSIGDGIVTTPSYTPPNPPGTPEPGTPFNVALYDGFFGVQSELLRGFDLAPSVSPTQTLYFGGRFKVDLDIGSDGRTVPQFYSPRLFLNRIGGDDRYVDINNNEPGVQQRDRTQDIALGIESFRNFNTQAIDNFVVARLGAGQEARMAVAAAPPGDGNWHSLVGKLELNVSGGANERLTVWIDPTGVETGGTMTQVEADVLPDLNALIGTLHSQGSRPVNTNGNPDFPMDPNDTLIDAPAELGRSYIDDMAIGTAWQDVATVNVPRLTLRINRASGAGTIVNNSTASLQLNGYSLESSSGALNGTGWNSLDEQNVGNWLQNEASANLLVETFLAGSTTVAPGAQLALGNLFTTGQMEDVTGRFSTPDNLINLFQVQFVTGAGVTGDYNNNGTVDAADYVVWRDNLNSTNTLPNDSTPGMVNQADYDAWRANFGRSVGGGALIASSATVPEPSAVLVFLVTAVLAVPYLRWPR
jgi:hypothetical protein